MRKKYYYFCILITCLFVLVFKFDDVKALNDNNITPEQVLAEKLKDEVLIDSSYYGEEIVVLEIIYDEELGINNLDKYYLKYNFRNTNLNRLIKDSIVPYVSQERFSHFFRSVAWISRNGVISLSILANVSNVQSEKESSWVALTDFYYGHPTWIIARASNPTSYQSMYNQYVCHVDWALVVGIIKGVDRWNIEPYTTDKGYWGFANFSAKCN